MLVSEQQQQVADAVREFAQARLKPFAGQWDREHRFPTEAVREMAELGLFGMLVPEAWDGSETGYVAYAMALEEIAAGDGSCSTIASVHNSVACVPILNFGSDAQRERFLRPLARGDMLGAFALTEPQAGSDARNIQTTARREGDGYVLNGAKQFITSGAHADVVLVFARTGDPGARDAITAFIVPTDTRGFSVARVEDKLGQRASDTCVLNFDDLHLPADCRLGEEGAGYRIALANLEGGRIGIAAQAVGMARAAYEAARDYARERSSFGRPIIEHQAVAFRLADMATQITAARQLVLHAAALREAGRPGLEQACMAKLFASEMAERVCSDAIQTLGGYGYLADYGIERIYRDVRVCQIYEGTSDIQRMVIARNL
ncbi:acyl-CoA dehydrogenase family protein [Salinisphaera sp. T31B1]|uniref:acyl-CoA dehydrogenase family protein n=1 Tax=Salinisphaera sp. T31B1 TaxID=727963 RepID=UPI00333ED977